jgi:hypothetical protein
MLRANEYHLLKLDLRVVLLEILEAVFLELGLPSLTFKH